VEESWEKGTEKTQQRASRRQAGYVPPIVGQGHLPSQPRLEAMESGTLWPVWDLDQLCP
jgi:hypothetical protein